MSVLTDNNVSNQRIWSNNKIQKPGNRNWKKCGTLKLPTVPVSEIPEYDQEKGR